MNFEQLEAINASGEVPLLISAGPGSGKTATLINRVVRLCNDADSGLSGSKVLLVTFSKSAVQEMMNRLQEISPTSAVNALVCTFHSLALRIVRDHGSTLGYTKCPSICSSAQRTRLIREEIELHPELSHLLTDKKKFKELIALLKRNNINPHTEKDMSEDLSMLNKSIQNRLKASNLIEFSDMVPYALEILSKNNQVLNYYQISFKYILSDEFQDANTQQRKLLFLLGQSGRITVVGDRNQLIYGFQGADRSNFAAFESTYKHHRGLKVISLKINYRSSGPIIRVTNAVINSNFHFNKDSEESAECAKNIVEMKPMAGREEGNPVLIVECVGSEDCEISFISSHITQLLSKGMKANDVAVLCRSNESVRLVARGLKRGARGLFGVSVSLSKNDGDEEVIASKQFPLQSCIAKVDLALDIQNNSACEMCLPSADELSELHRAIKSAVDLYSREASRKRTPCLFECLQASQSIKLRNWTKVVEKLSSTIESNAVTLASFIEKVVRTLEIVQNTGNRGIKRPLQLLRNGALNGSEDEGDDVDSEISDGEGEERGFRWLTRIKEAAQAWTKDRRMQRGVALKDQIIEFMSGVKSSVAEGLPLYGEVVRVPSLASAKHSSEGKVWVSTVHKAKGRQFRAVIVAGACEEVYGMGRTEGRIDEDQRLLYVALSRSKEDLCVCFKGAYNAYTQNNRLSPLLAHICQLDCVTTIQWPPAPQAQEKMSSGTVNSKGTSLGDIFCTAKAVYEECKKENICQREGGDEFVKNKYRKIEEESGDANYNYS